MNYLPPSRHMINDDYHYYLFYFYFYIFHNIDFFLSQVSFRPRLYFPRLGDILLGEMF
jgi:hypothetical protein